MKLLFARAKDIKDDINKLKWLDGN
jgi:hypothetical protein